MSRGDKFEMGDVDGVDICVLLPHQEWRASLHQGVGHLLLPLQRLFR